MSKILILFPMLLSVALASDPIVSPWHHEDPEIFADPPQISFGNPLVYPTIWDREREILDYNPRFLPNIVTFDWYNNPVIRAGVHDPEAQPRHATLYQRHGKVDESYLQTQDGQGVWVVQSVNDLMSELLDPLECGPIFSGTEGRYEKMVFDASGDAYTVVETVNHGAYLLHGNKAMSEWNAYALPEHTWFRIESSAEDRPPVMLMHQEFQRTGEVDSVLSIISPEKTGEGKLTNLEPIELVRDIRILAPGDRKVGHLFGAPNHSGMGDLTVTLGDKTHVVYGSSRPIPAGGTPQYIVTYDRANPIPPTPRLLGSTTSYSDPSKTDNHCGPAIVADSQGYLHVVLGSHRRYFKYLVSTEPNSSESWSDPVNFGNHDTMKETYVSLVIDAADTLHLVSRMTDENQVRALHYLRKRKTDSHWRSRRELVRSAPEHYSIWYQKLTIDERGRLFLAYFYYSHHLTLEEFEAYQDKWPNEMVTMEENSYNAHDPVIMMSDNGGNTWRIALSEDFKTPKLAILNHTSAPLTLQVDDVNSEEVTLGSYESWASSENLQTAVITNTGSESLRASVKLKDGNSYNTSIPVNGQWSIPADVHSVRVETQ